MKKKYFSSELTYNLSVSRQKNSMRHKMFFLISGKNSIMEMEISYKKLEQKIMLFSALSFTRL